MKSLGCITETSGQNEENDARPIGTTQEEEMQVEKLLILKG
jgi:hypothetical protein